MFRIKAFEASLAEISRAKQPAGILRHLKIYVEQIFANLYNRIVPSEHVCVNFWA